MIRVRAVQPLDDFQVRIEFTDGDERIVNLEPYLHGPVFESLRANRELFRSMKVDPELGTIVWENGADIDPDVLHEGLAPAWMEETAQRKA